MLATLFNWSFVFITCFITGFFMMPRLSKSPLGIADSVICGVAVLTVYAGFFSLIAGVGLVADLILIVACILFVCTDMDRYRELFSSIRVRFSTWLRSNRQRYLPVIRYILYLAVILVCAYFTAAGKFTYDTGTYHAQSIHWIETYGVVRGLAHMQTRLGFNSSYFCLCALYSFHFLGRSLHTVSGFLACFTMLYSLRGLCVFFRQGPDHRKPGIRHFLYLSPFAYFVIIAVEIISPATDHGVIWLILWLVIRWVELSESEDKNRLEGYALLSVLAVFLVSVKLSVGVLVLLCIYPACLMIKEKKFKDIAKYLGLGVILVLPYLIRNVIITGWLIYPFPALDLFNPDWKVPLEGVKHEADEIVVWARYTRDTALIDQTLKEWLPVWWEEQGAANRWFTISAFTGSAVLFLRLVIGALYALFRSRTNKNKITGKQISRSIEVLYPGFILLLCFLFFMLSAPSNRFGYSYILLIPLYISGDIIANILPRLGRGAVYGLLSAAVFVIMCFGMIKGLYMFASDDSHYVLETGFSDILAQKDYPEADYGVREWEGMTVYYPSVEGDQIWYHAFPAILYEGNLNGIERRGDEMRDGFRMK